MINDGQEGYPLLTIQIELYEKSIRFSPSLKWDADDGLLRLIEKIFDNIFHIADSIPRVFQPPQPTELRVTFRGEPFLSFKILIPNKPSTLS